MGNIGSSESVGVGGWAWLKNTKSIAVHIIMACDAITYTFILFLANVQGFEFSLLVVYTSSQAYTTSNPVDQKTI